MQSIIIRPAQPDEIKKLQALNDEIFVDNYKYDPDLRLDWAQSPEYGGKYFSDLLNNRNAICLIAEVNGKVIGYLAATPKEIGYRKSHYLEIENMGVSPDFRSSGVGSQLMTVCIDLAKEQSFQKIYVNSYFKNTQEIDFYKRNGFSEIDISLEKTI